MYIFIDLFFKQASSRLQKRFWHYITIQNIKKKPSKTSSQDQLNFLHFRLPCKYFLPKKPSKRKKSTGFFKRSDRSYHLPNLHDVVFWNWTDYPWLSWIPWKVWNLSCMTTVNKLERDSYAYQFRFIAILHTNSSGGPSSASSLLCSSPIVLDKDKRLMENVKYRTTRLPQIPNM